MLGMCSSFHISHALHSKEQVGGGGQRFSICSLDMAFVGIRRHQEKWGLSSKLCTYPQPRKDLNRVGAEASKEGMYLIGKGPGQANPGMIGAKVLSRLWGLGIRCP